MKVCYYILWVYQNIRDKRQGWHVAIISASDS